MKIELKNIKTYERMSEETTCFTADLFVNGKKLCSVENTGKGGSTDYQLHNFNHSGLLKEVEQYCKELPKVIYHETEYEQNLESVIDDLLEKHLDKKADLKLQKDMEKGLVYGNKKTYFLVSWGKENSIAKMLTNPNGVLPLRSKIKELLNNGETILNTNLPQNFLEKI